MAAKNLSSNVTKQQQQQQSSSATTSETQVSNKKTISSTTTTKLSSGEEDEKSPTTGENVVVYDVEHLATFSTNGASHESKSLCDRNRVSNDDDNNEEANDNGDGDDSYERRRKSSADSVGGEPKVALQRLFELEKLSGIWTQRMQIELKSAFMLIVDCETNSVVERFDRESVVKPEAFNQYNDIYNNIVVFTIRQQKLDNRRHSNSTSNKDQTNSDRQEEAKEDYGELHIFQCVSHDAQQLVSDILAWKSRSSEGDSILTELSSPPQQQQATKSTSKVLPSSSSTTQKSATSETSNTNTNNNSKSDPMNNKRPTQPSSSNATTTTTTNGKPTVTVAASSTSGGENVPIVNVNVKETVQVFNQIAALREKSKPTSPTRPLSDASAASSAGNAAPPEAATGSHLYKQRSIRATLAPKFLSTEADQEADSSRGANQRSGNKLQRQDSQQPIAGSSPPSTSASSASSSASKAHQQFKAHNQSSNGASNHHDADHQFIKQQVDGLKSCGNSKTRSHHSHSNGNQQQSRSKSQSDSSRSHASSSSASASQIVDQVTTNESYVSVLNHCFDDIEKFIIRVQQAQAAIRELHIKKKLAKRSSANGNALQYNGSSSNSAGRISGASNNHQQHPTITASELAMLSARARGPNEDDYFEILSKFKLAFNLLAKLKGCIHEPNAPELVHFLFTPLAIIINEARTVTPPIDPTIVGIPYLNQDALDLLSNCCTSKESDMWLSLGPNWTQTIDPTILKASRLPSSFQPIFSDGWAPVINELELIGLVVPPSDRPSTNTTAEGHRAHYDSSAVPLRRSNGNAGYEMDQSLPVAAAANFPIEGSLDQYAKGMNGSKSNLNGSSKMRQSSNSRHYKSPSPPHPADHHLMLDPQRHHQAAYFNQDAPHYGHRELEGLDYDGPTSGGHHKSQMRNSALYGPANGGQQVMKSRGSKHGASRHRGHLAETGDYDLTASAYPLHPSENILDYPGYPNAVYSDDYSELPEHQHPIDDSRRYKNGVAGPSSSSSGPVYPRQHYRAGGALNGRQKLHSRYPQQPSGWPAPMDSHDIIYDPHQLSYEADSMSELEREAMLIDLGPAQTEWFYELQSRGALIVRVLFTRDANNDKELSVRRGEILEVLDDTRKWWRTRNINLQVAHVPHTIVAIMQGYQTIDELLTHNPSGLLNKFAA